MTDPRNGSCRVVILDDESGKPQGLRKSLEGLGEKLEVNAPEKKVVEDQLDLLYKRRAAIDAGKSPWEIKSMLDEADVLIVDFDLRHLGDHMGFATGEEIAYSARLFSKAKILVVLNHPNIGLNNFDLTLQRDREFRADLYVGFEQCKNPGLWISNPKHKGFLPWSWIPLIEDVATFDQCLDAVRQNPNALVLKHFGLDRRDTCPSPEMLAYLGIKSGEDVSWKDLLRSPRLTYVREQDREPVLSDPERRAQLATALLRKWLRRWIVPSQTVLADMPHLASALPWALKEYQNHDSWEKLAACGRSLNACDLSTLFLPEALEHEFKLPEWCGRPAFFMRSASAALAANELPSKFKASDLPPVSFAEDLSRFVKPESAVEYGITLDGQSQLRSVATADNVGSDAEKYGFQNVIYSPESLIL
jgi:hypothetical protein